jgi:hypothetical protein
MQVIPVTLTDMLQFQKCVKKRDVSLQATLTEECRNYERGAISSNDSKP